MKALSRNDSRELRWFALGLALLVVGAFWGLLPWLRDRPPPLWPLVVGWVLCSLAWVWPPAIWPIHRAILPVARVLATVNTWLLLGVVFFGILWPVGAVLRRLGRLQYRVGFEPDATSYRVPVPVERPTRFEEPF